MASCELSKRVRWTGLHVVLGRRLFAHVHWVFAAPFSAEHLSCSATSHKLQRPGKRAREARKHATFNVWFWLGRGMRQMLCKNKHPTAFYLQTRITRSANWQRASCATSGSEVRTQPQNRVCAMEKVRKKPVRASGRIHNARSLNSSFELSPCITEPAPAWGSARLRVFLLRLAGGWGTVASWQDLLEGVRIQRSQAGPGRARQLGTTGTDSLIQCLSALNPASTW